MANAPDKVLVRGVNWLGDAVMTTPALLRLREARPGTEIVLLTSAKLDGLWAGHPAVDRVLTFQPNESVLAIARRLRAERFSAAIVLPNSPRSALEVFLARIPQRAGYARPWRRWLLTRRIAPRAEEVPMHKRTAGEVRSLTATGAPPFRRTEPPNARAHHLFQYLHLVACAVGARPEALAPVIAVTEAEVEAIQRRFGVAPGGQPKDIIGINPGAEYGPAKRWPAERFVAAMLELGRQGAAAFWILGGPADRSLAETIANGTRAGGLEAGRVRVLAGETSLRELCAALKSCRAVLTNDTGPMHVAAAVGTPVIVPFGSTSWHLTGPGLPGDPRHRFLEAGVPCAPCFLRECPIDLRCLNGISTGRVVEAVLDVVRA